MATCGSLSSLFEKPLPENPTLIESLSSWAQIMAKKPIDPARFTEIFGELHFQEKPDSTSASSSSSSMQLPPLPPPSSVDRNHISNGGKAPLEYSFFGLPRSQRDRCETSSKSSNEVFLLKNSDSLQLCTEGLGSESSDDVDDLVMDEGVFGDSGSACDPCDNDHWKEEVDHADPRETLLHDEGDINGYSMRPRRRMAGRFPPPIPWLGRSGKPCICFKSYRVDGRFILREMRIPTQEFLQASRQDGRLKLHFVQPEEEEEEEKEIAAQEAGGGGKECQKDQERDEEEEEEGGKEEVISDNSS